MSVHRLGWRFLCVLLLSAIVLMLTTASGDAGGRAQSAPSISLSPGQGPPGTSVTVTGTGWAGNCRGRIHWDSKDGTVLGSFTANPNGAFSVGITIPGNATPTGHVVWACTDPISPIFPQVCASRSFKVTGPPPTPPPPPTATPIVPTATPVRTECDAIGVPGEIIIDFERLPVGESLTGTTLPEGVHLLGDIDLRVFTPSVATHSGSRALRTDYAGEFGSGGAMMHMSFDHVQDFVGMYVGLNEQIWARAPITAVLTAYAIQEGPDGRLRMVEVGTDSVSFGPAATPIKECLSVAGPGIAEFTLTYGSAGEPEVIDDLILRGPEVPVPVPEDDQPPEVTILMPEDGVILGDVDIRLQGQVREDRELAALSYRVNMGDPHDLVFTPAGLTPEGDHLYLFAVEPLPVAELRTCGDNLVTVDATDASGNTAWDGSGFQLYVGDLEILEAEAVQVVYGADLVRGKGTAFRVRVRSTFTCDVSPRFLLELPEGEWSTLPPATGNYTAAIPAGWKYPDTWGPVVIPAGATDFAVMLPFVPEGQEDAAFSSANPAGVVEGQLLDGVEGPDVRVVPRPIAEHVTFTVEINPTRTYPEQNETNNRFVSRAYPVVTTRSFCFYIVPILADGSGPESAHLNIKQQLEFLLAIFPFADSKITWKMAPLHSMACPDDPTMACDWAMTNKGGFTAQANLDALLADCDVAVMIGHRWGGSSCLYCREGVVLGDGSSTPVLAHEFSHGWVGVEDIYSLDCLVDWDEFYCEYEDGHREYYCQDDAVAKPSDYAGPNCYCPDPQTERCSSADMICVTEAKACALSTGCSAYRRTEACKAVDESEVCDRACAEAVVLSECAGAWEHWSGPDCRIQHGTSEGFWVNEWLPQPAGQAYIMDCTTWPAWTLLGNTVDHCEPGKVFPDGYANALRSADFVTGADPPALLVRGAIHRSGAVDLQPFLYLPEANLDRAEEAPGDYRFVLLGEDGEVLSHTGINVAFERTGVNGGPTDTMPFALRIAWAEGTRRVAVQDADGREVASVPVTAHAPEIELLSPNGGETWRRGQVQSIRWRASDADGGAMRYFVAISPDGGENWWPAASDLVDTEYRLETDPYPAGGQYLLRVIATDGVNTTTDVSEAPFAIVEARISAWRWAYGLGIGVALAVGIALLLWAFSPGRRARR